jgi:hypothetical protein
MWRSAEPVLTPIHVDNRPNSVDKDGRMWTFPGLQRGAGQRIVDGSVLFQAARYVCPRLSTGTSTNTAPFGLATSTERDGSSTGVIRTVTSARPRRPHHDDDDDGVRR